MEPLTTQTFSGDRTEPEPLAAETASASAGDDTLAVPFRDFAISDDICRGLEAAGLFTTFPIQALTLPLALRGQDIIGQARTGTGKTLAFGIPLLQMLGDAPSGAPKALVVVPTRELAIQVADDLRIAAVNLPARILTVYGGRAYEPQIDALEAGVDIVVGTPGRLLDLVERRHLNLGAVQALVLDEADKMLDLGFLPDVERIVKRTPDSRQTMLVSATMPGDVVTLARRHMRQPTNIRAEGHDAPAPPPNTRQHVFRAHQMDKIEVLARLLQARDRRPGSGGAGAAGGPQGQGGRAHRDRGRGPRAGRGRRHPRGELRMPGRRHDLCAPHRPDRPGRAHRCRRHVRRLAGHASLEADQRRAEPGQDHNGS